MKNVVNLDVLVVYSAGVATSASDEDIISKHPFLLKSAHARCNRSYAYFLDVCDQNDLSAGFTTSADIIAPGKSSSFWSFKDGTWTKVNKRAKSCQIFDKISPTSLVRSQERSLLLANTSIRPFNDADLFNTFFDKFLSYKKYPADAIPTVVIKSGRTPTVTNAISKLRSLIKKMDFPADFSKKLVLKDRFGAGGNHVYKINNQFPERISKIMKTQRDVKFVLQPLLLFDKGFGYKQHLVSTDIRLIFHHNKLLQSYLRLAKENDFRCNAHQGGQLIYVKPEEIPQKVHTLAKKLLRIIDKPNSLFALDFVISNSGHPYFVEGNIGPGIDWDVNQKDDEKMSKQLIRSIVKEISSRVIIQHQSLEFRKEANVIPSSLLNIDAANLGNSNSDAASITSTAIGV